VVKYRWIFLGLTFVLLGIAFYRAYTSPQRKGPWSLGLLYGTAALRLRTYWLSNDIQLILFSERERKGNMEIMVNRKIKQVLILIFSTSVLASGQVFAQERNDYGGWGMWPGMKWGFPMGWFAMIFMSIFWIAAIVGLIFLVRRLI
jgi:hypothetical protein